MSDTVAVEVERLRGEINTGLATLSGKIDALSAVKSGDHDLIAQRLGDTDRVAKEARTLAHANQKQLERMWWVGVGIGVGSGLGSGGAVFALAKVFGIG